MTKVKTLTRSDIADAITAEFQVTKFEALDFIHEVLSEITGALAEGEDVKLTGFGTFKVHDKKERMGRNPKTKEPAVISARRTVSFRASPILKKKVDEIL